jgi:hypothetical protein
MKTLRNNARLFQPPLDGKPRPGVVWEPAGMSLAERVIEAYASKAGGGKHPVLRRPKIREEDPQKRS